MKLPFEAVIALRYIRSRRKAGVSLITLITIFGVTVGVSALTVVTSVWNGFEAEFLEKLLGINAHAVLLRNHEIFRNHGSVADKLRKAPGIQHVAPFVFSEVIAQSSTGVQGVLIKGIDPVAARSSPLSKYVEPKAFDKLASKSSTAAEAWHGVHERLPGILIGPELKASLHVEVGDTLTIISPYGARDGEPRTRAFELVDVFHSGMYEFDSRMVLVNLVEAQRFFKLYDTVTGLEVWSDDPMSSQDIVFAAARTLEPGDPLAYEVRDWSRTNRGIFGAVKSQKVMISIVLGFIVLVAAFNIMATLILLILEKGREIAILKSLGATDRSILTIFVLDGQIVGVVGCVLGILLGLMMCAVLEQYGLKLDPRVYYLEHLPILVRPVEIGLVAIGAMTAATLATLFPAFKAARMPPVEGLTQRQSLRAQERGTPTPSTR